MKIDCRGMHGLLLCLDPILSTANGSSPAAKFQAALGLIGFGLVRIFHGIGIAQPVLSLFAA